MMNTTDNQNHMTNIELNSGCEKINFEKYSESEIKLASELIQTCVERFSDFYK